MGYHKSNDKRGPNLSKQEVVWFVRSTFQSIAMGLADFPRSLHHYTNSLWRAYEGDLRPLTQALNQAAGRSQLCVHKRGQTEMLRRWKTGMGRYFGNVYFVLNLWHQILTDYVEVCHGNVDAVFEINIGRTNIIPSEVRSVTWEDLKRNIRIIDRTEI